MDKNYKPEAASFRKVRENISNLTKQLSFEGLEDSDGID